MSTRYVCSACSFRIARQASQRICKETRTYSSTSHAFDSILSQEADLLRSQSSKPSQPRSRSGHVQQQQKQRQTPRSQAQVQTGPPSAVVDFTSYVASTIATPSGRYSRPRAQPEPADQHKKPSPPVRRTPLKTPALRSYTSELEELLNKSDVDQAWAFFSEHYTSTQSPALAEPSFRDLTKVRSRAIFGKLLTQVNAAYLQRLDDSQHPDPATGLPAPVQLLDCFESLEIRTSTMYAETLWTIALHLSVAASKDATFLNTDSGHEALSQLMELWKRTFRVQVEEQERDTLETDVEVQSPWEFVPANFLKRKPRRDLGVGFARWLDLFIPVTTIEKGGFPATVGAAILTTNMLNSMQSATSEDSQSTEIKQYFAFAKSVEVLLARTSLDREHLVTLQRRYEHAGGSPQFVEALLQSLAIEPHKRLPPFLSKSSDEQKIRHFCETCVVKLGRCIETQDLDGVERMWVAAQAALLSQGKPECVKGVMLNAMEHFLMAFLKLRRPQAALEVWNAIVGAGIQPTVRTWSVMMKGCHISRDIHVMESMWHRMRGLGIQPDVQAWSTRIYGLLRVGKIPDGLRALEEMGREWIATTRNKPSKAANKQDSINVPKPDTAILNSALTALRNHGSDVLPKIVAWSQAFGIEPDIITYNALLSVSLANGHQEGVQKILKRMADTNTNPDSATVTILLNSLFRSSHMQTMTPSEQEHHIMDFISTLETNGVAVDEKGYGIVVDRLLKEYNNELAVHTVLAHMAKNKVAPTPHIYTILMTHYFDSDPPNLYAAEALWNQIQSSNNNYGAALDVIFFDRMVEGYARHGDIGRTMTFLTHMSKEGKRPGWVAMAAVVRCLVDKNDWERLSQVVLDCHKQEGLLSAGLRGTKGQAEFWRLVSDLGVLDRLDI